MCDQSSSVVIAGVDRAERAHEVAGVSVLRPVDRRERAEDVAEILVEQRIGGDVLRMPSQMCRCVSMNPGITIMPRRR